MKFYKYEHRDAYLGGIKNDTICRYMYVEAETPKQADKIFCELGGYFDVVKHNRDCCCEDRWQRASESNSLEFPLYYDMTGFDCSPPRTFKDIEEYLEWEAGTYIISEDTYRVFYLNKKVFEISTRRDKWIMD